MTRPARSVWGLLAGLALVGSAQGGGMPRLPRAVFDVIAPSTRVRGERGEMRVYQSGCRIGPTHWARRRIVDIAIQEWAFFGFQTIDATRVSNAVLPPGLVTPGQNPHLPDHIRQQVLKLGAFEDEPEVAATIAGYWSATPRGPEVLDRQNDAWNGDGGAAVNWVEPWSAAFVSWVMCEAGLGEMGQFHRSIAHWRYVDQAIRARAQKAAGRTPTAASMAYDPGERPLAPGDLLCAARAGTAYRDLADRRADLGSYAPMHCDIVVGLPRDGKRVFVIGGNVLQSVSLSILPLVKGTASYPHPRTAAEVSGATTEFAHLVLQADRVDADPLPQSPTLRALRADPGLLHGGPPDFLHSTAP